jgi:hypothetical protein
MAIHRIPAFLADATPIGASSNTQQAGGVQEDVGRRLSVRHLVAARDGRDPIGQADFAERVGHVLGGGGRGHGHGDLVSVESIEQRDQPGHWREVVAREVAVRPFLLAFADTNLLERHVSGEQQGEDLTIALAVDATPQLERHRGQPMPGHEGFESLRVPRHVVYHRAIEVEDHGDRAKKG